MMAHFSQTEQSKVFQNLLQSYIYSLTKHTHTFKAKISHIEHILRVNI